MLLVGRWGTPVPHPARMTVVFGKPIEVPHLEDPADGLVRRRRSVDGSDWYPPLPAVAVLFVGCFA
jgi:hypothetical protein